VNVIEILQVIKPSLEKEGFAIDGVVGSYAYGDYTDESDVDILYHIEDRFMQKHEGFSAFSRIAEIKNMLTDRLGRDVDLIASRGLSKTAKKYMLSKVLNV